MGLIAVTAAFAIVGLATGIALLATVRRHHRRRPPRP